MNQYDILVIGAGPAGLAAAHAAASCGRKVGIIDDNPQAGGQIWRGGPAGQSDARARALWQALQEAPQVHFLLQTRVLFSPAAQQLQVQSPSGSATLHYQRLILATGARERLLPFPGWTLPGVTGAGALQALAKGGYPVAGKRVVIAAHGNSIRALVKYLDNISDNDIVGLNIPNGIPLVYELDADLKPIRHYYLGDAEAAAKAAAAVASQGKA